LNNGDSETMHPDLAGRVDAFLYYGSLTDAADEHSHGTHVTGIIAARGNNTRGVAGVCWQTKIVCIKILGPNGGTTESAIAGIQYAIATGVRLTNNSWGGGASQALYDAIAAAGAAGQLFVVAASNSGQNADILATYPGGFDLPNIVTVAATDNTDNLWPLSDYGPLSIDIGAPGVAILSTLP